MELADVQELADKIMAKQRASRHAKHAKIYEPRSTTASALGYKCERRLVYARTRPECANGIGEELASIFEEGNLHQSDVRKELIEIGHEAFEAELSLRDKDLEIGARIDGMLAMSEEHRAARIVLEIKSCTGKPPVTASAMRYHDGIYGRQYAQMQTYLFLKSKPFGMFLFKDKITGLWYLVPVPLDYDYAEALLRKAEHVRDHIKAGTLPGRLADRSECKACPFNESVCLPADAAADQMLLADDQGLLRDLSTHEAMAEHAKEFKRLDESIKTRFKMTKGSSFVIGDEHGWLVEKKKHGKGFRIDIRRLSA